jgi:hypothetical protein
MQREPDGPESPTTGRETSVSRHLYQALVGEGGQRAFHLADPVVQPGPRFFGGRVTPRVDGDQVYPADRSVLAMVEPHRCGRTGLKSGPALRLEHEAAGGDRDDLPATQRLLRPELRLACRSCREWETFLGIGVGTELLALGVLLVFFKRRGWF